MAFRISALDAAQFAHLAGLPESELGRRDIRRLRVDASPGYPCRVSLRDADLGETVYLLHHIHHDRRSPYRASHAIFVIEGATTARPDPGEVPAFLRGRLLSVRAFDAAGDLVAADVVDGLGLEGMIERMLDDPTAEFLHLHNAGAGCYLARVDRATG